MDRLLLAIATGMCTAVLHAQTTLHSVSTGDWSDPATWDCSCSPLPGDSVLIDHEVTLDVPFASSSGTLVLGQTGALQGGAGVIFQWGGAFVNNGVIDLERLSLWPNQFLPAFNNGSITVSTTLNMTMFGFTNAGAVNVDSLYMGADIANEATGTIEAAAYGGLGMLENDGAVTLGQVDLAFIANAGSVLVTGNAAQFSFYGGNIEVLGDAELQSISTSGPVLVHGNVRLDGGSNFIAGPFQVEGDLHVAGSLFLPVDDALVNVGGDLRVTGSIGGQGGSICVADSLINDGSVIGLFDLCDLSPSVALPPFVDVNTGTIGPAVSFCATAACAVGMGEAPVHGVSVAPNPTTGLLQLAGLPEGPLRVELVDALGRILALPVLGSGPVRTLDLGPVPAGAHVLRVCGEGGCRTFRVVRA